MMKNKKILSILILYPMTLCSCAPHYYDYEEQFSDKTVFMRAKDINSQSKIKNVIMFIGDGMGYNQVNAGSLFKGSSICFADETNPKWTYHALVCTDSLTSTGFVLDESKSLIHPDENKSLYDATPSPYGINAVGNDNTPYTDSAAAGTALATGFKTVNGRIGKDQYGNDLQNLTEIAHDLGKKTAVISTDTLVGATPSAYLAHVEGRYDYSGILDDDKIAKADLIITKKPSEWDDEYHNAYINSGYDNVIYDIDDLDNEKNKQLLLHDGCSSIYGDKNTLANEVVYALDYLDNDPDGFFMMVEGADIDKKAHANDMLAMFEELMGFDRAVQTAIEWADSRDDTLILVSADHETGGFYYNYNASNQDEMMNNAGFKSTNHSRSRVRLDVYGDISEFTAKYSDIIGTLEDKPYWDNTWIFNLCCSYL